MGRLIPLIGAAVVALAIGFGAGWFLKPAPEEAHAMGSKDELAEEAGFTYTIKDKVVNLADPGPSRKYLKISLALQITEAPAAGAKRKAPPSPEEQKKLEEGFSHARGAQVNDVVISVLSSKRSDELLSIDGKERLREELKGRLNALLPQDQKISKIFLTDFIIQ
jgi:flagellar FliL protein